MIKREVIISDCRLLLGDSQEIMPLLGKVDSVVTDPPFLFNVSGGGIFRRDRTCMDDIQAAGLDKGFDHSFLEQALCDSVVVFCHNDQLPILIPHLSSEFPRFALCAWHKENPMPVANKHYKPDTEFYIHAWNDKGYPIGELADKGRWFLSPVGKSEFDHPTVKPLPLMGKIIKNVQGNLILDPFMGTGSTGVACVKYGRSFIGIEREDKYFDIAVKRIQQAYDQPDMFLVAPQEYKQEKLI